MSDDALQRRAAALELATVAVEDPAEQLLVGRLRVALGGPAAWMAAPALDLAAIMATAAEPDETTQVPEVPAGPVAGGRPEPGRPAGRRDPARPGAAGGRRGRRPVRVVIGLAAAALVLVVAGVVGYQVTRPGAETATAALAGAGAFPSASAAVQATSTAAGWRVTLTAQGLPPAPQGAYYEAWLGRDGTVVPLGTFHMRGPGEVELWSGVEMPDGARFMVTLQRVGNLQPQDLVLTGVVRR